MGKLEDDIRDRIDDLYGGVPAFAKEIGLSKQTVYSVLRRGLSNGTTSTVLPILAKLRIDSNWILRNKLIDIGSDYSQTVDVPLYGNIAAGNPIEMEACDDYFPVPSRVNEKYPDAFLLKVVGESMNRILPNGCYALVDPCMDVEHDGKPYAVCVNGYDATIKRVRRLNNGFELVPDSTDPTFKPAVYDFNDEGADPVTVIGEVVYYVLPCDWGF